MSDNFDDNIFISKSIIDSKNSIFSPESNIIKDKTSSFNNNSVTKLLKELLQELYIILLTLDSEIIEIRQLNEFVDNFLFEYDLDPKSILEIMTSNSQNIFCYSSLIGFFYQHGIGCEVDEVKAFEIFSNSVKNNQKEILNQFSFDQKNDAITFCNDDIKKLDKIILQYFYSLFLYKDIILYRNDNYKLHVKNSEKGVIYHSII